MDACRDVDPVALGLLDDAAGMAGRAWVVDDRSLAAALRARLRDREEALALGVDPGALAARTGAWGRSRPCTAAMAGRALARGRYRDRDLRAVHRLVEAEADLALEVAPALLARPRLAAAAEERGDDVPDIRGEAAAARDSARAREASRPEAGEASPRVVLLALLLIGEDVVRLLDLLEVLLGLFVIRVAIRMPLAGELPVGLLDLVLRGALLDAQDLVEVARRSHY